MAEFQRLRVFISSPGDVRPERLIAERVIERLDREFSYHFRIEAMLWEREPLVAGENFQDGIVPPHETDIVVVILWSRLGVPLPADKYTGPLSGGTVTGTEWEFEDALASYRNRRQPDLLLFRKKAEARLRDDETAAREHFEQKRLVEEFMTRWTRAADGSFTAASWEFTDAASFEDLLENHLRELIRRRLAGADEGPSSIRWHHGSPFRGLQSFDLEHAPVFFGRTRARNDVRELLVRQIERGTAFVLVMGASGSGKSSLVKAGVLADLKLPGMIGRVALVRHAILRPADGGGDLIGGLAAAILASAALPELETLQYDQKTLTALLRDAPSQASLPIRQGLAAARLKAELTERGEARLLVVVDQLEEIFTQDGVSQPERDAFVAALAALAESQLVWVIATLRSDFFNRLETLPCLARLSSEARYLLTSPEPAEIAQIIRQPAHEAGVRYETDATSSLTLDEKIRAAASSNPGALPLLSFLLDQLWQNRSEHGDLTFDAYGKLGELEGAIGKRAEMELARLSDEARAALPTVLRTLVTVGQGSGGTATARAAAMSQFPVGSPARQLVDAFLAPETRLLIADGDAEGVRVRVAHEALLSHWPRASDQIAADSRDLELLGRLEHAAARWGASERKYRDSLALPRGLPLIEALALKRRWGKSELPAEVAAFIGESHRLAKRQRRRTILTLAGAVALLPIVAGIVWAVLVWRGVRQVEGEMAFVPIPQGCFVMGSPPSEVGRFDHETPHQVCIPAFDLGKFAVTQEEWRLVMVENPAPSRFRGARNPVEMISWDDARAFAWRMRFFGSHPYRLPSEAQWEYAARAGTTTAWFWGDRVESGCAYANMRDLTYKSKHFNVDEAIINCADGYDETAPVGSLKPNPFGLFDMVGNVFQWTQDCFGDYAKAPSDGTAAEAEDCKFRVVRGGSWTAKPRFTRSASRDIYAPVNRNDVVGLRLAR